MIEDLPSQLFSLHNLEKLNLFGNRLSGILSSEFSKLKKVLQICSLRNNMMYNGMNLTLSITRVHNFQLKWLNVGNNMVEGLPASFGDLTGIVHLDLSCNKIDLDHLPNSFFGKEMLLERLYLSDNDITEVSENFSQLVNLKILALRYELSNQ